MVSVTPGTTSVVLHWREFPGAKDYRVRLVTTSPDGSARLSPFCKYSGLCQETGGWPGNNRDFARDGSGNLVSPLTTIPGKGWPAPPVVVSVPNLEVRYDNMTPGVVYNLVIEAVSAVGPYPAANLYDANNAPVKPSSASMPGMAAMLGSNRGLTGDGMTSTNGQGPSTSIPVVIARSAVIACSSTGKTPLVTSNKTTVFSTFQTASVAGPYAVDWANGNQTCTITDTSPTGQKTVWNAITQQADILHSTTVDLMNGHLMDDLFDGGMAGMPGNHGNSLPTHNNHAITAFTPVPTVEIGRGHILHATMEVDGHCDTRRWLSVILAPADAPVTNFYTFAGSVNALNKAVYVEIENSVNLVQIWGPGADQTNYAFSRAYVFGPDDLVLPHSATAGPSPAIPPSQWYQQVGRGLDDRSRFDVFASQTAMTAHVQLYEDGCLIADQVLPLPLGFDRVKVYFGHYCYHTTNEVAECRQNAPWETNWIGNVPYSDERHWANMGYEVLPNTPLEWASTAALAQPAQPVKVGN